MDSIDGKQAVRKFLKEAICNFTRRVSGAHSWYKHLSIGREAKFEFFFNTMVNWRLSRRGEEWHWEKKERGDGSEFHYTWLPTDEYHKRFAFFDCRRPTQGNQELRLRDSKHRHMHVPVSLRGPTVDVTAAVHHYAIGHCLYDRILDAAVRSNKPDLVYDALDPSMFVRIQHRQRRENMRLPEHAACVLKKAAMALIEHGIHAVDGHELLDSPMNLPAACRRLASKALIDQQKHERLDIALSLREVCFRMLGEELTPSIADIISLDLMGLR